MLKTFCFKLYNSDRNKHLMRLINIAGLIYNHCIALYKRYYRMYGKHIHKFRMIGHLVKLKRTKKFAFFKTLDAQAVQEIVFRIDRAYNLFWSNRKRGIKTFTPKFRKVKKYKSFTMYLQGWKLDEANGKIRICKRWYRYFKSRSIEGKVKTVTVKRDGLGDIYIYITCDVQCDTVKPRTGKSVGFGRKARRRHFGLKRFLTGSNGHNINSPDFFALNAKIIHIKSRSFFRKKNDSNNRKRACKRPHA